jgi:hypothetical protein
MSDNYRQVMAEVDRRVNALIAKGLTDIDATSQVFREDRELYQRYARASAEAPAITPESARESVRESAEPNGIEREVMRRAEALVRKEAGLSYGEAVSQTFRDHPELYLQYVTQDSVEPAADRPLSAAPAPVVKAPTEPRASEMARFIPEAVMVEVLKTAGHLAHGNYAQGLQYLTNTLREIRGVG